MKTLYETIIQYRDCGGNLADRLTRHGILDTFQPLHTKYILDRAESGNEDHLSFNRCVFYIAEAYSHDSGALQKSVSWDENKQRIAVNLSIEQDCDLYFDLVDLRCPATIESMNRYLDYQGSENWQHLVGLKDLYIQLVNSARAPLKLANNTIDYKRKVENMKYAEEIMALIHLKQQAFDQELAVHAGMKELRQVTALDRQPHSIKIEDIAYRVRKEELQPEKKKKENKKKEKKGDDPKDKDEVRDIEID